MNWTDVIKDILVTGLSAFGGAWAAFFFESWRERRKEKDEQYRALRFAHFVVMSQYQELITLRDSYLQTLQNPNDPGLRLHPVALGFASPSLKVSELGFVLEGSDPDLLNRLTIGQQRYETVRNLLASRNQLHVELQRRAAALQAQGVDAAENEEALHRMLGKDLVTQLKSLTAAVFEAHERATSLLEENLSGISEFASTHFPDRRTPRFEVVPQGERR